MIRSCAIISILFSATVLHAETQKKSNPQASAVRFDPVKKNIEGWTVFVDPSMLRGEHAKAGAEQLSMLGNHLQRIKILLPSKQLKTMQTLEIWIERHHTVRRGNVHHPINNNGGPL